MVFRKKFRKGKKGLAAKVNKIARSITSIKKAVVRQKAAGLSATVITNAGSTSILNGLQVGNGDGQRSGNAIQIVGYDCRCWVQFDSTALAVTYTDCHYRNIMFYDRGPNGATPAVADYLNNIGVNANNHLSPFNLNAKDRIRILSDKQAVLSPTANTRVVPQTAQSYDGIPKLVIMKRKFKKPLLVRYDNGNVGDVTDISMGGLFMYETCSNNTDVQSTTVYTIYYME